MTARRGFTLIEMMVVIAVIGVLAATIIPSIQDVTMKARDARRKADLNNIQLALERFYEDNGYYPPSNCGWDCNEYRYSTNGPAWIPEIVPYLRGGSIPRDPINNAAAPWSTGNYSYTYGNVGRTTYSPSYDLTAQLENPRDKDRCGAQGYRFYFDNRYWCTAFGGSYSNQIYEIGPMTQ